MKSRTRLSQPFYTTSNKKLGRGSWERGCVPWHSCTKCNKIVFKRRDMSRHDLVSAQISNVCIIRHAALNAIAYIVCVKQFVMSLPAISLGDWFSVSRKGGTGGGGLVYTPKGWKQHGCVWVGCKKSLSRVMTQMVLETVIHLTGPPSVFKCDLLASIA